MKPRKPDFFPKIRISIGNEDLKKLTGGSRRTPAVPPTTPVRPPEKGSEGTPRVPPRDEH